MTISATCASCGAAYEMPDDLGGQIGQCACGATFQIPHQPAAVAIPVETPDSSDNPFSAPTAEIIATTGSPVQAREETQIRPSIVQRMTSSDRPPVSQVVGSRGP